MSTGDPSICWIKTWYTKYSYLSVKVTVITHTALADCENTYMIAIARFFAICDRTGNRGCNICMLGTNLW